MYCLCGAGRLVQGAPECMSYLFNADGKCSSFTGGYIMDRRVGNTQNLGAMLGILKAIGARIPVPGSLTWSFFMLVQKTFAGVKGVYWFWASGSILSVANRDLVSILLHICHIKLIPLATVLSECGRTWRLRQRRCLLLLHIVDVQNLLQILSCIFESVVSSDS